MTIVQTIQEIVASAVAQSFPSSDMSVEKITIEYPKDASHGDYATNIAMSLARTLGRNPREVAEEIIGAIGENPLFGRRPEVAGPGFINFTLANTPIFERIDFALTDGTFGSSDTLKNQRIFLEFACPNTHKVFHIGHLRNVCLGESLARIFESQGAHVYRGNYQGDVGPHVAKCLWGMKNMPEKDGFIPLTSYEEVLAYGQSTLTTPRLKADYLGAAYSYGGTQFEEDKDGSKGVQSAVKALNKKIYEKDSSIMPLWELTRSWSLEYLETVYALFGTRFDGLFFESMMYEKGKAFVMAHLKSDGGIFEASEGAYVFKGEEYGLHTRVFITKEGNATYEGKEMVNILAEREAFEFDRKLHVIAHDQSAYFEVIKKASELIDPTLVEKQSHVSYGLVKLTTGKMASRTGNVVKAQVLYEDAKEAVRSVMSESKSDFTESEKDHVISVVALASLKFTMLHADSKKDISFDLEKSVKLTGDSGPYLLYSLTRMRSILAKVGVQDGAQSNAKKEFEIGEADYNLFTPADIALAKKLLRFEEEVSASARDYTTHNLTHFLLDVAGEFSAWYENNHVIGEVAGLQNARLKLVHALENMFEKALHLLGIETLERM